MTEVISNKEPLKAIIYCRVSSTKQAKEGHGLESQESRCREYAKNKGYEVATVFQDDVSGGGDFMKRPMLVALLSYLDSQPDKRYVIVFDDLKRFARDTEFHIKLRQAFKQRNAKVECLNFKFEDTPEGKFIETILAAQGELERDQNGRQVIQKMTARLKNGYWVFRSPVGLKYDEQNAHGKILVPDEPLASVIKEALEGYASGRFQSQTEVNRFLQSRPEIKKNRYNEITYQQTTNILTQPLYSGYIHFPKWDVNWLKGNHSPLISAETFQKIQKRRDNRIKMAPARKNLNLDFPLRGFVNCGECNKPYTSCWSQGKTKKYPYYLCDTKGCSLYRKSIRREDIEGDFEEILHKLQPTQELFNLAKDMFKDAWEQRSVQSEQLLLTLKQDLKLINKQIEGLVDRVIDATNDTVATVYEAKLEKLGSEKRILSEKIHNFSVSNKRFDDFIELSLQFLSSPCNIWKNGEYSLKRLVLRLAFSEPIAYHKNEGYRTPKISLPFSMLRDFDVRKPNMVPQPRVELGTY